MKNLFYFIITFSFILSLNACKKDKLVDPVSRTAKHFPMAVGNYWVYDIIRYNNATYTGTIIRNGDIIEIVGTKEINGKTYFEFKEQLNPFSGNVFQPHSFYRRDSSDYIVDEKGIVLFSAVDFDRVLTTREYVDWLSVDFSVKDSIIYEFTPAGSFECLNLLGTIRNTNTTDNREIRKTYGYGVGMVFQNTFILQNPFSNIEYKRVLTSYHLE